MSIRILNKITLIGNIGKEPTIHQAKNGGDDYITFSMATYAGKDDKGDSISDWHQCVAFKKNAEFMRNKIHKGTRIMVEGVLKYNKWSHKIHKDVEIISAKILVSDFHILDKPSQEETPRYEHVSAEQGDLEEMEDVPF